MSSTLLEPDVHIDLARPVAWDTLPKTRLQLELGDLHRGWKAVFQAADGRRLVWNPLTQIADTGTELVFRGQHTPGFDYGIITRVHYFNAEGEHICENPVIVRPLHLQEGIPCVCCLTDVRVFGSSTTIDIGTVTFGYTRAGAPKQHP